MDEKQVVDLGALLDAMIRGGEPQIIQELAQLAEAVGQMFHADPDEVAILAISPKNKSLKFVIPEKLSVVGSIPLTSTSALAARTVRERKTEMANNFNTSRHASVFEGVPLGRREGQTIYNTMTPPILPWNQLTGCVPIYPHRPP